MTNPHDLYNERYRALVGVPTSILAQFKDLNDADKDKVNKRAEILCAQQSDTFELAALVAAMREFRQGKL